jgi:riboflavin synthase
MAFCLTVTDINLHESSYCVTAIEETLFRTNLGMLKLNDSINVERCLKLDSLIDGHLVQGHVDTVGICTSVKETNGSWKYFIEYDDEKQTRLYYC